MSEEELFCKLFPEYVVNGKPLSPYFDLFESGYEQAEKRIAELQERIKTLEYRCENIKDTDTMELVALQRENAELQHKIDTLQGFLDRDVEFDNLQKENAELKTARDNCEQQYQDKVAELGVEVSNLIKAKELLAKWVLTSNASDCDIINIVEDTEQFLNSEVEK